MATQVKTRPLPPSRSVEIETCPYCGQPLLNQEAARHLRVSERETERKLDAAAKARAEELAEALKLRFQEQLKAAKTEHQAALRELRLKVRAEAKSEAEREAEARVRGQLRAQERALHKFREQVEVQQRQIEHLTADERGDLNEEQILLALRAAFPDDQIERRGRGRAGGDILHQVRLRSDNGPTEAGLIVYECKDTLAWNNAFLEQARREGATHKTPYLVIITQAFPRNEKTLCVRNGIVVVHPSRAVDLARIMRRMVEQVYRSALTGQDQAAKNAELYEYLASSEFRQAFDTLAGTSEALAQMLGKEKKWHEQTWAKRQSVYDEIGRKTAVVDARITAIMEKHSPAAAGKVVKLRRAS